MLMPDILVSVIVPIYNVKFYLERCINSIIKQTYRNIEIILVDDGSTDGCADICERYVPVDKRIRVIHKANGGLVSARKAGTEAAKGDYILNVDGDDWIEDDRIQNLVRDGLSTGTDMVYMSGLKKDFGDRSILVSTDVPCAIYDRDDIINKLFSLFSDTNRCFKVLLRHNIWMWAVKRELLQRNQRKVDDRIIMAEDQACIWYCLLEAESVTVMKESGYHYIQERKSAITYAVSDKYKEGLKILFSQMLHEINQCRDKERVKEIWISAFTITVFYAAYDILLDDNTDFLFPYEKVSKGSRIAVYGAGKAGKSMMTALEENGSYQVMLWVDKNVKQSPLQKYKIESVDRLSDVDYDYVIIAVADADMAEEINIELTEMGIEKGKIATMNAGAITEERMLELMK